MQCRHLTHLLGNGARDHFFDLVGDRTWVGGAIPGLPLVLGERGRVLGGFTGKVVVWCGERLDFDLVDGIRQVGKLLSRRGGDVHAVVVGVAGFVDAGDLHFLRGALTGCRGLVQGDRVANPHAEPAGERLADHALSTVVFGPAAVDRPP